MIKDAEPVPFAIQMMEQIPVEDLETLIPGEYNSKLQVWEATDGELSTEFPVASFPGGEGQPTVSTRPTRITVTITQADTMVDD